MKGEPTGNHKKRRKKEEKGGIFFKKPLTNREGFDIIAFVNGASPSGKATDSDSVIT